MKMVKIEEVDLEGYMFPDASDMVDSTNDQLDHIIEEVIEVRRAETYEDMLVEIYDIIHCCESLLRFLGATPGERIKAQVDCVSKNAKRGYYECD